MSIEVVTIEKVVPTRVWIEDDFLGARHVMVQHEGMHAFEYATFNYDYAYTSNSDTWKASEAIAVSLGATTPVEHKQRAPKWAADPS